MEQLDLELLLIEQGYDPIIAKEKGEIDVVKLFDNLLNRNPTEYSPIMSLKSRTIQGDKTISKKPEKINPEQYIGIDMSNQDIVVFGFDKFKIKPFTTYLLKM